MTHHIEYTIFLDFLNREACEASGLVRSEIDDLSIIEILLLTKSAKLSANISQLLEYSYNKPRLMSLLRSLIKNDVLISTSTNSDINSFLDERQRIYSHDTLRYPMYFQDTSQAESLVIKQNNTFSMTRLLRRDILDIEHDRLGYSSKRVRDNDRAIFLQNVDIFKHVLVREESAAVTKSVFLPHLTPKKNDPLVVIGAAARVFSALYMDHYAAENSCVTCTGIFESGFRSDPSSFPLHDIPTLRSILEVLGYYDSEACRHARMKWSLEHYCTPEHRRFSYLCRAFIESSFRLAIARGNDAPSLNQGGWASIRNAMAGIIANDLSMVRDRYRINPTSVVEFLRVGASILGAAGDSISAKSPEFGYQWRKYVPEKSAVKFLLMTATDVEEDEVHSALAGASFIETGRVRLEYGFSARYITSGSSEVFVCRTSAGGSGSSGSHLVTSDAIRVIKPNFVIASGICFGIEGKGLRIGDIVVSESVANYEAVRQGELKVERGKNVPCGPTLLGAAREVMREYRRSTERPRVKTGLMLCGEKLVDDPDFISALKDRFPDAVAGEMEAVGIQAAAQAPGVEWLVAKSICDWGYAKEKVHQKAAAEAAARFVVSIIHAVIEAD